MNRAEVIQRLLPKRADASYLEIGVQHGYTFHAVRAGVKVAVDPQFAFDVASVKIDPENAGCRYHEITSNEYFTSVRAPSDLFDVIFIDGLHTFDQTLKDFLNALVCLKPDGLIVVDDVMPVSYASAISDVAQFLRFRDETALADGSWMGDVYKVPFFIKNYLTSYRYATVLENCAQMVVWRTPLQDQDETVMSIESICQLEYMDFVLGKKILNLLPIDEIERQIGSARGD